jgi:Peptidase family M28
MAALPPSRHERRARPGSLASPVNSRMYRGTWLLVGIPLLVAAFTVHRPDALSAPQLQPEFDGPSAAQSVDRLVRLFPNRTPGSSTAHDATNWVAEQLREFGLETEIDRFHAKIPGRGDVELENVSAVRKGRSNQIIVVVAHRDNSGASPGANDNASGTAALIELARSFRASRAPPQPPAPNNTILFLSTDAGAFGGLGAEHFASTYQFRERVVATVNLDAIGGRGPPHLVFNGDTPRAASAELVRTASARILDQTGAEPTKPRPIAQLLDLAFPFSLYEQAPFVDRGVGAITITSAGDRPSPSFADTQENLAQGKLTALGRSSQWLLESLDNEVELAEGTSTYVYLGERVVRGWAIVLILFTALLPALAVIVDLFARLRRRHIPLAPALRSYRSRLAFWLYAVLLFVLFALLGVWETGADRPLPPELSPGTQWPTVGLAVYGALLATGWLIGRDRLLPRRPVADAEQLAGQVGALLALAVLSLLVVAMNPYSVLFLLPSLHAWIWLPQIRNGPAVLRAVAYIAGFGGPLLLLGSLALRFDLGFDAPWYLAQLAAVGFVPLPALLVTAAWLAVAGQLAASISGRYAPYPAAGERPRLGVGRRLVRTAVFKTRRRRAPEERKRAFGP